MQTHQIPHPPISSRDEWLTKRLELLAKEKEATSVRDRVASERRRLPMVRLDKDYEFQGQYGRLPFAEAFEGRHQLIIYHLMFDPEWTEGCPGCTGFVDALGDLSMLSERDTAFALVSRAPLEKLEAYKQAKGWNRTWYSSFDSDFNYDFHATLDSTKAPVEYNYLSKKEIDARGLTYITEGEQHGISVFFCLDGDIYHAYSAFARGTENLTNAYELLDITPYGRQEDWEDSPADWPQRPTYG